MDVSIEETKENTTLEVVDRGPGWATVNFTGSGVTLDVDPEDCDDIVSFFRDIAWTMRRAA